MTETKMDLVERLRELDRKGYQPLTGAIGVEAADEIELLRSILNCIVIRRTDGSIVISNADYALNAAAKYMTLPQGKQKIKQNEYNRREEELEDLKCPVCSGSGTCDDADVGDISYNSWTCKLCSGSGIVKPAKRRNQYE